VGRSGRKTSQIRVIFAPFEFACLPFVPITIGKKLRNFIGFPLHPRKLSAGILISQHAILSRPKHTLGSDKLAREASEAVSEPAIIEHNRAAVDIHK
jgi:hypothetical protein